MLSEIDDVAEACNAQAASLVELDQGVPAPRIYTDLTPRLASRSALALDIGVGTGRNAA